MRDNLRMENIFKDAKFGDKFKTRDGKMAIFLAHNVYCEHSAYFFTPEDIEKRGTILTMNLLHTYDGHFDVKKGRDIVSRW